MMQAMIFAAGLGTRLRPLTDTMPKALVEVCGEPLLSHVVHRLKDCGANRIVVNVHHFSEQIISYLSDHDFGLDISISDESGKLLDTGGGIKKALPLFDNSHPILIHNVDILSNVDLRRFYDNHGAADAQLLVSSRKTKRYLLFDDDMRLVGWTNIETGEVKSPYAGLNPAHCRMFAFSGIHTFSPRLAALMSAFGDKFGIIDFYLGVCHKSDIRGHVAEDLRIMDVGKAETLADADTFFRNLNIK
ncbi:MAG: nucleotidyltransferase family protein [Prevotella sp.]